MSRKNPEGHKDLLKRAFQREEADGVARYVYHHDDRYYFVLAACTRLDLDFEAKSDRLIVPADVFESTVLEGAEAPALAPAPAAVEDVPVSVFAAPVPAADPHPLSPVESDAGYEEEEFVFGADPALQEDEDADVRAEEPSAPTPAQAPVFVTHQFIDETGAMLPITPEAPAEDEEEEFVFMTPEDEEIDTDVRWDGAPIAAAPSGTDDDHREAVLEWDDVGTPEFAVTSKIAEEHESVEESLDETEEDVVWEIEADDAPPATADASELSEDVFLSVEGEPSIADAHPQIAEGEVAPVYVAPAPVVTGVSSEPASAAVAALSMAELQERTLTKRTEGIHAREQALSDRERAASEREKTVVIREDSVEDRRKDLGRRERRIERRRKELEALERKLKSRREYLVRQRDLLDGLRRDVSETMDG